MATPAQGDVWAGLGERLHQPGSGDLLARYPALTALRAASQSHIEWVVKTRSPQIAAKVSAAMAAVLAAQGRHRHWRVRHRTGHRRAGG